MVRNECFPSSSQCVCYVKYMDALSRSAHRLVVAAQNWATTSFQKHRSPWNKACGSRYRDGSRSEYKTCKDMPTEVWLECCYCNYGHHWDAAKNEWAPNALPETHGHVPAIKDPEGSGNWVPAEWRDGEWTKLRITGGFGMGLPTDDSLPTDDGNQSASWNVGDAADDWIIALRWKSDWWNGGCWIQLEDEWHRYKAFYFVGTATKIHQLLSGGACVAVSDADLHAKGLNRLQKVPLTIFFSKKSVGVSDFCFCSEEVSRVLLKCGSSTFVRLM